MSHRPGQIAILNNDGDVIGYATAIRDEGANVVNGVLRLTYEGAFDSLPVTAGSTPPPLTLGPVVRFSGNPILSAGASGTFNDSGVRDGKLLYVDGQFFLFYTGNSQVTSPFYPTIGVATSPDGFAWTDQGQVIAAGLGGSYDAGGVFSPGVFYEGGVFYLFGSVISNGAHWYSGPIQIALYTSPTGLPGTFTAQGVVLTQDQAWEDAQGVYAPDIQKIRGRYVMYYSSATGTGVPPWRSGAAFSDSLTGTWEKYSGNPTMGDMTDYTEEPAVLQMPSGGFLAFFDQVAANGVSVWQTTDPEGLAGWEKLGNILPPTGSGWEANYIGSSSAAWLPSGQILLAYNARATAATSNDDDNPRAIGVAVLTLLGMGTGVIAPGLFTPVLKIGGSTTGITYSTQRGDYGPNGSYVDISIRAVLTSKGAQTGNLTIGPLPVPPIVVSGHQDIVLGFISGGGYTGQAALIINGNTSLTEGSLYALNNGVATQMTQAHITNTSDISFTGRYLAG